MDLQLCRNSRAILEVNKKAAASAGEGLSPRVPWACAMTTLQIAMVTSSATKLTSF
jgi:hypothetical protein